MHLRAKEEIGFVLGLKAGFNNFSIDYNRLNIYDPTEFVYSNGNLSETKPIIGAGFYFYGKKWFFGMSVPNIVSHRLEDELNRDIYNKISHFYTTIGFDSNISQDVLLKSQALIQMVEGAPISALLTTRAQYRDKIALGLQYQPEALYGAFVMLDFSQSSHLHMVMTWRFLTSVNMPMATIILDCPISLDKMKNVIVKTTSIMRIGCI